MWQTNYPVANSQDNNDNIIMYYATSKKTWVEKKKEPWHPLFHDDPIMI